MKSVKIAVCAAACMLLVSLSAFAGGAGESMKNTVSVNGSGSVSVIPNMASVTLAVVTRNADVTKAASDNAELMLKVESAIRTLGIAKEDMTTSDYDLYQEVNYKDNKPEYGAFRVTNNLTVTVRDMEIVGAVIDAAVNAGANQLSNVSFYSDNTESAVNQARTLAVEQGYWAAKTLAESAGRKLGKVLTIQEYSSPATPRANMERAVMFDAKAAGTPINPGTQDISVTVSLVYELN